MKLSSEEDIKVKVVLDYLRSLGFKEDELSFEDSFRLNLGRSTYKIDTSEQKDKASPRLDILVTRNNTNLFIIEVKSDLVSITKDEINQAISYARLVDPVAPFTIISNGKEFHLYDSLTKKEINNNDFEIRDEYKIALPDDYRYEALKHFIGYSKENFSIFFKEHVNNGLKTLLGSKDEPNRKFIPELHTSRNNLFLDFKQFLESEKSVFSLLGESGSGKTCSMCDIALRLVNEGFPVLFYKSLNLVKGIVEIVAEDINWVFSPQSSDVDIFRRLEGLFSNEKILIFIDAVDEWEKYNKVALLNRTVSIISNKNIKLIISCKSNSWDEFIKQKGTPTEISLNLFKKLPNDIGYLLPPFSEREFSYTIKKYRKFYEFNGAFESGVLDQCRRSPFMLRVFFEVAHKYNIDKLTFSSQEFFHEYYYLTLEKVGHSEIADATLKKVAECLFDRNSESIDRDDLRQIMGLSVNETLLSELFSCNVLDQITDNSNVKIRFYFDKFRDFIIANLVKKWSQIDVKAFEEDYKKISSSGVQSDALTFFYNFTDIQKKKVIDGLLRKNSEKYLELYIKLISEHFPNLKTKFSPETEGDIGFIAGISIQRKMLGYYGFRTLKSRDEGRVKFIPIDDLFPKRGGLMHIFGADRIHSAGSANGFKDIDIEYEVIKNEIAEQLRGIVINGKLNEINNIHISSEKAFAIFYSLLSKHRDINSIQSPWDVDPLKVLPVCLDDIELILRYEEAFRFYQDERTRIMREKGIIKENWDGSRVSYSYSYSKEDWLWIKSKAYKAAVDGIQLKSNIRYLDFEPFKKHLSESLKCLKSKGINEIKEILLPAKDKLNRTGYIWDDYTVETLIVHISRLYKIYLDEYKTMVETNFPTLKEHFELYSMMPIKVFFHIQGEDIRSEPWFIRYICKDENCIENEVFYCDKDDIEFSHNQWSFKFKGKKLELKQYGTLSVSDFFGDHSDYLKLGERSELLALQNLVYSKINYEIDAAISALFRYYGISDN